MLGFDYDVREARALLQASIADAVGNVIFNGGPDSPNHDAIVVTLAGSVLTNDDDNAVFSAHQVMEQGQVTVWQVDSLFVQAACPQALTSGSRLYIGIAPCAVSVVDYETRPTPTPTTTGYVEAALPCTLVVQVPGYATTPPITFNWAYADLAQMFLVSVRLTVPSKMVSGTGVDRAVYLLTANGTYPGALVEVLREQIGEALAAAGLPPSIRQQWDGFTVDTGTKEYLGI